MKRSIPSAFHGEQVSIFLRDNGLIATIEDDVHLVFWSEVGFT